MGGVGVEQVADEHVGTLEVVHAGVGVEVAEVAALLQDRVAVFVEGEYVALGHKAVFRVQFDFEDCFTPLLDDLDVVGEFLFNFRLALDPLLPHFFNYSAHKD